MCQIKVGNRIDVTTRQVAITFANMQGAKKAEETKSR